MTQRYLIRRKVNQADTGIITDLYNFLKLNFSIFIFCFALHPGKELLELLRENIFDFLPP